MASEVLTTPTFDARFELAVSYRLEYVGIGSARRLVESLAELAMTGVRGSDRPLRAAS
ncbi:MAG: hypothetical protein LKI25_00080 [Atopobiaceae bacterium]|jgi:hypothetical protein|nr:hypothetical protein [Atopobiaceae bacterium]MCI2172608.1 hypothetical protein [Atopobiaceae bacterium]MCI2206915.1 hypothetical protein [Atopobiaceae bacterium]